MAIIEPIISSMPMLGWAIITLPIIWIIQKILGKHLKKIIGIEEETQLTTKGKI